MVFSAFSKHCFNVFNFLACLFFSYLVTIMGLTIPWSFTLAIVDGYSVLVKCPVRQPGILLIIVLGDWVCSICDLSKTN
jgi:hypothetical protein